MPLSLKVATPERVVYTSVVDTVVLPTDQGELGILPGHISLIAVLSAGVLRLTTGGRISQFTIDGGMVNVQKDRVMVLTRSASQ